MNSKFELAYLPFNHDNEIIGIGFIIDVVNCFTQPALTQ